MQLWHVLHGYVDQNRTHKRTLLLNERGANFSTSSRSLNRSFLTYWRSDRRNNFCTRRRHRATIRQQTWLRLPRRYVLNHVRHAYLMCKTSDPRLLERWLSYEDTECTSFVHGRAMQLCINYSLIYSPVVESNEHNYGPRVSSIYLLHFYKVIKYTLYDENVWRMAFRKFSIDLSQVKHEWNNFCTVK